MKPVLHERPKKGAPYPPEFRQEAVRYWLASGKKASEVAAELGVSDWSLERRVTRWKAKSPAVRPPLRPPPARMRRP
jgi:transposase-like protein